MATGTIKWFKGFGFITPDSSDKDLFVDSWANDASRRNRLVDGARVSFDTETGRNGRKAVNVSVL
ncbi:unannotated protein [freshwater metagenome]|uniref:Unannotated protein n=1 Tax=freshwater metagenome TaxID=449393 RepID=A0A6J7HCK5_9ZZZZ|nr:cold-shock protein [Actinomycetota bacterium]